MVRWVKGEGRGQADAPPPAVHVTKQPTVNVGQRKQNVFFCRDTRNPRRHETTPAVTPNPRLDLYEPLSVS